LDQTPELWQTVGDLIYQAQAALIARASGANLLLQESLGRQLEVMRHELPGALAPSILSRACDLQQPGRRHGRGGGGAGPKSGEDVSHVLASLKGLFQTHSD